MSREKYHGARQLLGTKRAQEGRGFTEEGRGWAFTRRHDDGASSIWPTEYRSHLRYTPTVCHRQDLHIRRENEREGERAASHYYKKKNHTRETPASRAFWYPRAVKSLKPWKVGLSFVKWRRQTVLVSYTDYYQNARVNPSAALYFW